MPAGDRTGPSGMGPMTGRAAGYCAGYQAPGFANAAGGRGSGRGFGRGAGFGGGGFGRRNRFYATGLAGWQRADAPWPAYQAPPQAATMTKEQDLEVLKQQAKYFQDTLEGLEKQIKDIESAAEK